MRNSTAGTLDGFPRDNLRSHGVDQIRAVVDSLNVSHPVKIGGFFQPIPPVWGRMIEPRGALKMCPIMPIPLQVGKSFSLAFLLPSIILEYSIILE